MTIVQRINKGEASVLVVAKDNKVSQRVVNAAFTQGSDWVVTDGLENGERLIVQGSQKSASCLACRHPW